jgi:hypothetical protein
VRRQERRIELQFPAEAESHLVKGGSRFEPGTLMVHVHPHRLFARWTPLANMDNPPVFHGHIEPAANGFAITGTIRETRTMAALPAAFLLTCAVGITLAVLGVTGAGYRAVSLVVGIGLTIVFGALFVESLRRRRPRFRRQAGELEHGIDSYVRTGDAKRQPLA